LSFRLALDLKLVWAVRISTSDFVPDSDPFAATCAIKQLDTVLQVFLGYDQLVRAPTWMGVVSFRYYPPPCVIHLFVVFKVV
jgi:hypothetical protein